jgi:hypothetical protein
MRPNSTAARPYLKGRRVWTWFLGEKIKGLLTGECKWGQYKVQFGTGRSIYHLWIWEHEARRGMRGFRS